MLGLETREFVGQKGVVDVIDTQTIEHIDAPAMPLADNDLRRIIPLAKPAIERDVDVPATLASTFQNTTVVIGRIAAGAIVPEQGVDVRVDQRAEHIVNVGRHIAVCIRKDTLSIAVKNHPIRFVIGPRRRSRERAGAGECDGLEEGPAVD